MRSRFQFTQRARPGVRAPCAEQILLQKYFIFATEVFQIRNQPMRPYEPDAEMVSLSSTTANDLFLQVHLDLKGPNKKAGLLG